MGERFLRVVDSSICKRTAVCNTLIKAHAWGVLDLIECSESTGGAGTAKVNKVTNGSWFSGASYGGSNSADGVWSGSGCGVRSSHARSEDRGLRNDRAEGGRGSDSGSSSGGNNTIALVDLDRVD